MLVEVRAWWPFSGAGTPEKSFQESFFWFVQGMRVETDDVVAGAVFGSFSEKEVKNRVLNQRVIKDSDIAASVTNPEEKEFLFAALIYKLYRNKPPEPEK